MVLEIVRTSKFLGKKVIQRCTVEPESELHLRVTVREYSGLQLNTTYTGWVVRTVHPGAQLHVKSHT